MSPVDDGSGRVFRDKDSVFRDERGLLHMAHLTSFMASTSGALFGVAGLVAFFLQYEGATMIVQISLGLVASGAGLEGWQTHKESQNQRGET